MTKEKVEVVREHVKAVFGAIEDSKTKQVKEQELKKTMTEKMYGYTSKRLILRSKSQTTAPMSCDDRTMDVSSVSCLDFTRIPKLLDAAIENSNSESVLRSTTIKTDNTWTRLRQENLLSRPIFSKLNGPIMKKEKNKAFDLLDALSRSGSLPRIRSSMSLFV